MKASREDFFERLYFFRGAYRPRTTLRRGFAGLLALVDVLALLGLFVYAQSSFVLQPGVRMRLPEAPFRDGAPSGAMVVVITQEGFVFFNDERVPMEGLESAFRQRVHEEGPRPLLIEADGRVRHETLVEIYNMAARAGLDEVVIASRILLEPGAMP